jgi:hypothetical protein
MATYCGKCGTALSLEQSCDQCTQSNVVNTGTDVNVAASVQAARWTTTCEMLYGSHKTAVAVSVLMLVFAVGGGAWYHHVAGVNAILRQTSNPAAVRAGASPGSASVLPATSTRPPPLSPASPVAETKAITTAIGILSSDPDNEGAPLAEKAAANEVAGKTRVCSAVSKQEMEHILGREIQEIVATETTCQYRTNADHAVEIESTWKGGREAMAAARIYNAGLFASIPNLGDEAWFQAAGITHVRKGDIYIVINARAYRNSRDVEMKIAGRFSGKQYTIWNPR